jgi:hypothetical protein
LANEPFYKELFQNTLLCRLKKNKLRVLLKKVIFKKIKKAALRVFLHSQIIMRKKTFLVKDE